MSPKDFDFGDDLNAPSNIVPFPDKSAEQRAAASIINGGEATGFHAPSIKDQYAEKARIASSTCPACKGTKVFRAYTGRVVGACFKCKGTGEVTAAQVSAAKGKITKQNNLISWIGENDDLIQGMRRHSWNRFIQSVLAMIDEQKMIPFESKIEVARKIVAEADERDAARKVAREAEKIAAAPVVNTDKLKELFATAVANTPATAKKTKRPVWRAEGFDISCDRTVGVDRLWVSSKALGGYVAKIENGKVITFRKAEPNTAEQIAAIMADPAAAVISYKRKTGNCCVCGIQLVDPVSVVSGIGPICAPRWGLEWMRDDARDAIAKDAAIVEAAKAEIAANTAAARWAGVVKAGGAA